MLTTPNTPQTFSIALRSGERWWGGLTVDGFQMPFRAGFERDLSDLRGNQGMPLLLSNRGRYVYAEAPFAFALSEAALTITAGAPPIVGEGGTNLAAAYRAAAQAHFPFSPHPPDPLFFSAPQYNLWIELLYAPTQDKVLRYAREALRHGFPPGILMIDTNWSEGYGTWRFHSGRFPDPKAMIDWLHDAGFRVMLWVTPFVTADSLSFRQLRADKLLICGPDGEPAIGEWWDGYSATLDLLNPKAVDWLHAQLMPLVTKLGVDGFKFDGGQVAFYAGLGVPNPHAYNIAWNAVGLHYPLAEYKDSWRSAGLPIAQRIRDRYHSWDEQFGLRSLIPLGLAQSLLGYAYVCPDMVGGGDYSAFPVSAEQEAFIVYRNQAARFDAELFVRSAQCAALFPMMQFSAAPWRLLNAEQLHYCLEAVRVHSQFTEYILQLAQHSAATCEPMMRPMAYAYPDAGYDTIIDQFMLGSELLVAPVLDKGVTERTVVLPPGTWQSDDGAVLTGNRTITVSAPLSRLPHFRRLDATEEP